MSSLPRDEFETARRILWRYYDSLMGQAAEDIIQNAEEFEKGTYGSADNIIEKHYCRIAKLTHVYANLRNYASKEKPKGMDMAIREI